MELEVESDVFISERPFGLTEIFDVFHRLRQGRSFGLWQKYHSQKSSEKNRDSHDEQGKLLEGHRW